MFSVKQSIWISIGFSAVTILRIILYGQTIELRIKNLIFYKKVYPTGIMDSKKIPSCSTIFKVLSLVVDIEMILSRYYVEFKLIAACYLMKENEDVLFCVIYGSWAFDIDFNF